MLALAFCGQVMAFVFLTAILLFLRFWHGAVTAANSCSNNFIMNAFKSLVCERNGQKYKVRKHFKFEKFCCNVLKMSQCAKYIFYPLEMFAPNAHMSNLWPVGQILPTT